MPKVFIVEPIRNSIDISSAETFGPIVFLFESGDRRANVFDTENYAADILAALNTKNFNWQEDYICIVGSMIPIISTIAIVAATYHAVRVLLFRANDLAYEPHWIGDIVPYGKCNTSLQEDKKTT